MSALTRAVLSLVCGLVLVSVTGEAQRLRFKPIQPATGGGFDTSEYRQTTYGAPDRYCSPTRSLASAGTGTLGDPWNYNQCQTEPACGEVIGHLNVGAGTPVDISPGPDGNTPAFVPDVSCTNGNEMVHVTRYAAIALCASFHPTFDCSGVATSQNRTEIRHSGSAATVTCSGTGTSTYGSNWINHIVYDGFFVDLAEAPFNCDTGVIQAENATGVEFLNFVIKGANTTCESNCVLYRPNDSVDTVLRNFAAFDYDNDPTGGATPQDGLFSDHYGDRNVLIEHFILSGMDEAGIFLKGTANSNFNSATIRYGIVRDVGVCFQFNDLHATTVTEVYNNLCFDYAATTAFSSTCFFLSSETTNARNILIRHNTCARGDSSGSEFHGPFYARIGMGSNVVIRDNIFEMTGGTFGHYADFAEVSTMPATLDFIGYRKASGSQTWAFNGSSYTTIASWRTATSRDASSAVLASDPFVDRANANFTVSGGHAAKTLSSTGGEVGAYGEVGNNTLGPVIN